MDKNLNGKIKFKPIWAVEVVLGALCIPFGMICVKLGHCYLETILATLGGILLIILGVCLFLTECYAYEKEISNKSK